MRRWHLRRQAFKRFAQIVRPDFLSQQHQHWTSGRVVRRQASLSLVQAITNAGGLTAFNLKRRRGLANVPACQSPSRPMTAVEKLLARASGNQYVQPADVVFAKVDLAMSHDAVTGPVADQFYASFGTARACWDPTRLVLVADHFIQINDIRADRRAPLLHDQMRQFAAEQNCKLLDVTAPGDAWVSVMSYFPNWDISDREWLSPGPTRIRARTAHFGCFSTGIGTTDMANLLAMGDMWLRSTGDDSDRAERPTARARVCQGHNAASIGRNRLRRRDGQGHRVLRRGCFCNAD